MSEKSADDYVREYATRVASTEESKKERAALGYLAEQIAEMRVDLDRIKRALNLKDDA